MGGGPGKGWQYFWNFRQPLWTSIFRSVQFSSVTQSCPTRWDTMNRSTLGFPVHHQLPELTQNSCPPSWWCHPTISSSIIPFSCFQSFPASESFPMSQFFISGGQRIVVSASASVLPMNIQDWFPSGWTGWISLQSKGLSRVFSNTTVQKSINSSALSFLYSPTLTHSYMTTGKTIALTGRIFVGKGMSLLFNMLSWS